MAAPASLLGHGHDAVPGSRNRAPHEEKVALGVHPHHPKAGLGVPPGAHVTGEPLALDNSGRVGSRADRARLAMPGIAVGLGSSARVIAMDHALKAAALG